MATIKYFTKGKQNPTTIYVRFTNGKKNDYKRSTSLQINPNNWSNKKGTVKNVVEEVLKDEIINKLSNLRNHIITSFNNDNSKGIIISSDWLKDLIHNHFNRREETDLNDFVTYGKFFIEKLPTKIDETKGTIGVSQSTIKKYVTIVNKIKAYNNHNGKLLQIYNVDLAFKEDFVNYLIKVDRIGGNTVGRYLKFVKTICLDAKKRGIKTSLQLNEIKGFTQDVAIVVLSPKEITKIALHDFSKTPHLNNARDWLIVGLNTGLRVSDLLKLKPTNINNERIEVVTKKTKKQVIIPLHSQVIEVLNKYNWAFPRDISDQRFNEYIKEVCKNVGITNKVKGAKMDKITRRKEKGIFPKWQLISSHVCRRSFATNLYGKVPTPVIMSITGHSTETMFLTYIGKTSKDNADFLNDYWSKQENPVKLKVVTSKKKTV